MSAPHSLFSLAATAVTGFTLVTGLFLTTEPADAGEAAIANNGKIATSKPSQSKAARGQRGQPAAPVERAPATPAPQPDQRSGGAGCTCPTENRPSLWPRPKFADLKSELDESDQVAALESLQVALSETSDGGSFVWHRNNGRISGVVQPTTSFKDEDGQVCRHIHVMLTSGTVSKKTEGIACRLPSGQWQLEG